MPYIANTDADRREMLDAVGTPSMEALWEAAGISRPAPDLNLPIGLSEHEVTSRLSEMASSNADDLTSFLGLGFYDHIIPAVVPAMISRGEFATAYTPYQPEASQGTLQAMFEFQSLLCRLTGMEVANCSLYDGGTALFEAMMLGIRATRRRRIVMSGTVSPIYRHMIECYSQNLDIELVTAPVPTDSTCSDVAALKELLTDDTAALLVQLPNAFGTVEDWTELVEYAKSKKIITCCSVYPMALSLVESPGAMGFDVVTGEAQCFGVPLSFGGPYCGFMATTKKCMRRMPGRIVGRTVDTEGKEGFVLTLQAREQHIRRAGAMSNICTNEGLCALMVTVYMCAVGKEGLLDVGRSCAAKAVYMRNHLLEIPGIEPVEQPSFFNEFVIRLPVDAATTVSRMIDRGFAAGFPLARYYEDRPNDLLIAVTEKRTVEEMRHFAVALEAVVNELSNR